MEKESIPLAHRVRPRNIEDFVGQEHITGEGKPLRRAIDNNDIPVSIILWGPPGCGKTTLAKIIAKKTGREFVELSAVNAGKKDIEKVVNRSRLMHTKVILFLDEIHRFNKAQQDFLLPFVENGTITLIGATTENPSFEIISALLSRSRVFILNSLTEEGIIKIINNALNTDNIISNKNIKIGDEEKRFIAKLANGDARSALNIIEIAISISKDNVLTKQVIMDGAQQTFLKYDKNGEEHYNIISALHKSMRDSDADAAVYWTMRMIEAGEDPKYIIRRMIRFASEDIGNADPQALILAVAAKQAIEFIGYPECDNTLIQVAIYLAKAPKSNAVYEATLKARADIKETGNLPVPLVLRNAPTEFMKEIGYGEGYKYAHDYKDTKVEQQHLPKELEGKKYYDEEKDKKGNNKP